MFGIKTKIKRCIAHCIAASFSSSHDKTLEELDFNKKYKAYIPTYEKSNQIVHPDILVRITSPKYVLVFTPYPNTNDKFENPSIVISDDGINFHEEKKGLNPLVPPPVQDHNDDPDISFHDNKYHILYLETVRPDYQNLILLTSTDRINWEKEILNHEIISKDKPQFMLSPTLIYSKDECFLFAVNKDISSKNTLYIVKGADLQSLDFSNKIGLNLLGISMEYQPWHVDVFKDDKSNYIMLLCMVTPYSAKNKEYSLFIGISKDLINWNFQKTPVLKNCYRSSGFVKDGVLYIYFSSNIYADVWKTGLYKTKLEY